MKILYTISKGGTASRRDKVENRAIVLSVLLEQLGHDPNLAVDRDSLGRLHFPEGSHLDLSLSHAAPFTAYAVGEGRVGIDMEELNRVRHAARLAARFFTPAERQLVAAAEDINVAVCLVWTKKEALAKHLGRGLAATYHICTANPPDNLQFLSQTLVLEGRTYLLSLCADKEAVIESIEVPTDTALSSI